MIMTQKERSGLVEQAKFINKVLLVYYCREHMYDNPNGNDHLFRTQELIFERVFNVFFELKRLYPKEFQHLSFGEDVGWMSRGNNLAEIIKIVNYSEDDVRRCYCKMTDESAFIYRIQSSTLILKPYYNFDLQNLSINFSSIKEAITINNIVNDMRKISLYNTRTPPLFESLRVSLYNKSVSIKYLEDVFLYLHDEKLQSDEDISNHYDDHVLKYGCYIKTSYLYGSNLDEGCQLFLHYTLPGFSHLSSSFFYIYDDKAHVRVDFISTDTPVFKFDFLLDDSFIEKIRFVYIDFLDRVRSNTKK